VLEVVAILQNRPCHSRIPGCERHSRAPISAPLNEASYPTAEPVLLLAEIRDDGASRRCAIGVWRRTPIAPSLHSHWRTSTCREADLRERCVRNGRYTGEKPAQNACGAIKRSGMTIFIGYRNVYACSIAISRVKVCLAPSMTRQHKEYIETTRKHWGVTWEEQRETA
jgi:hypothetical protein